MDSLFGKSTLRYLKAVPMLLWNLLITLAQWVLPRSWYAKRVDDDIVLITGAGSGLGREIALEYAKLNSSLVLWDINKEGLNESKALIEEEYKKNRIKKKKELEEGEVDKERFCSTYLVDVSDRVKIQAAAKLVHKDLNIGRKSEEEPERYVSVLVNNAGIYYGLMLQDLRDDQIERIFKINILAHFWTVRAFLPKMIENDRGHIVEIASMGGMAGLSKQVDYCATKFATVGFEESLSIELDQMGLSDKIHTTVVCPFFFSSNLFTGFNSKASSLMTPEFVARETVLSMRCNYTTIMLPKISAYALIIVKPYLSRKSTILLAKTFGLIDGIEKIKGKAVSAFE